MFIQAGEKFVRSLNESKEYSCMTQLKGVQVWGSGALCGGEHVKAKVYLGGVSECLGVQL